MHIAIKAPESDVNKPKGQNTFRLPTEREEISKIIQGDVPSFITKEATEFQRIEQSLNTLKARLNGKPVENLTIKLRTLDGLARLLDPEISEVLNQIQHDLKEITQ